MRTLHDAPATALEPATGRPRFGAYRGSIERVDLTPLEPRALRRFARHKRWVWLCVSRAEFMLTLAIVDLGFAHGCFGFAWDGGEGLRLDASHLGLPFGSGVRRDSVHRFDARFVGPRGRARFEARRGTDRLEVSASLPGLELRASGELSRGATPLTVIAPLDEGGVDVTEKRALIPASGAALIAGKRHDLDGATLGFDLTDGLLARHTRWRWAFAQGTTADGTPVALNLTEGFVGELECTVWLGRTPHPVGEGRFRFDRAAPEAPWRVESRCGRVRLDFAPAGVHAEQKNLGVVRTAYVQPVGRFRGTIELEGVTHTIDGLPGVVEDQDACW